MAVAADAQEVSGFGRVWFSLLERPEVRYEFSSDETDLAPRVAVHGANETRIVCVEPVPLGLTSSTEGGRTAGRHKSMNSNAGLTAESDLPPTSHGEVDLVTVARAHLLNFADPLEFGGCILDLGQWTATIRSIAMEKPRLQSFTPTHVVDLARSDEEPFAFDDAQRVLEAMADAMTFASGRVVGLALLQGFDRSIPVRLEWLCTVTDPWRNTQPWWDHRFGGVDALANLIRRWIDAWDDQLAAEVLRRAARIYASAQMTAALDAAIPIAAIGWELMAWDALRRREQLVSADEFDRQMPAATSLRLALRLARIPTAIPDSLPRLLSHARRDPADGPAALVEVRNRLTHPPRGDRRWPDLNDMLEANALALEYLALLILASIDYDGAYTPLPGRSGWPGADKAVPWADSP